MNGTFRRRYLVVDLSLLTIVAVVVIILGLSSERASERADVSATISVPSQAGRPLPAGFLGLSLEYPAVESYAGDDPAAIDPVFEQLIRNLSPGQAPALRIGGASTDSTWWPSASVARPAGVTFTLNQRWLQVMRSLASRLNARLVLGINLEAASGALAATEAGALIDGIGTRRVRALELGNEPDLYGRFTWYRTTDGRPVTGRPASYDLSSLTRDFTTVGSGLPRIPLAGPAFGSLAWAGGGLAGFLATQPRLGLVTLHRYPLQSCFTRAGSSRYPTIDHLLAAPASAGLAHSLAPFALIAHGHGAPLVIDELSSVSCGAAPATSNSFASALWALDALFELARSGIDGVNVHTFPGAGYELFRISSVGGRWRASVAPEYYGLLMFAQATPRGSRLLALPPAHGQLKLWATRAPDGRVRVILINKDQGHAHVAVVRRPGSSAVATLERLQAPSVTASTGVTIGGQSFGTTTDTGTLRGPVRTTALRPAANTYRIAVPPGSAALLTLP